MPNPSKPLRVDFDPERFLSEAPNLETLPTYRLRQVQRTLGNSRSEEALYWRIYHILEARNAKLMFWRGFIG